VPYGTAVQHSIILAPLIFAILKVKFYTRRKNGGGNMEQRQLTIVIFVIFFLIAGFIINQIDLEYLSVPQILADFNEWIIWKLMPGW
jgi:hypothetical protein